MSKKRKFRMAVNPTTRTLQWAPEQPGLINSIGGWLILTISTVLFIAVAGYFAYVFLLSAPKFDVSALPGGGPSVMQQQVQKLH